MIGTAGHGSDSEAVCDQLRAVLTRIAKVRLHGQKHAFGSTTALDAIPEVELDLDAIGIPLETEFLPARTSVRVIKAAVMFRVNCKLREIRDRQAIYAVEIDH